MHNLKSLSMCTLLHIGVTKDKGLLRQTSIGSHESVQLLNRHLGIKLEIL